MEEYSYLHRNTTTADEDDSFNGAMEMELQQQLRLDSNQLLPSDQSNWEEDAREMGFKFDHHHHHHHNQEVQQLETPYPPPTPDPQNLFHLPRCSASSSSFLHNSTNFLTSFPIGADDDGSTLSDPSSYYLSNIMPQHQPPLFKELLQSLPHGYSLPASMNGSGILLGGGGDEEDGDGRHYDSVLEFIKTSNGTGRGIRTSRQGKIKHFTTERDRRSHLNAKFTALRNLIPNPTKVDRASIVGDAIEYIKELLRTVDELKILVEKRRNKKRKREEEEEEDHGGGAGEVGHDPDHGQSYNGSSSSSLMMRSSWLQRKSKETEVDVRIVDDEVTIKLVQRKKINCLLYVSKVLDELKLDLHHVAGGHIGDYNSLLFNTKIHEGCSVYASSIANKLIEVVDRQ